MSDLPIIGEPKMVKIPTFTPREYASLLLGAEVLIADLAAGHGRGDSQVSELIGSGAESAITKIRTYLEWLNGEVAAGRLTPPTKGESDHGPH